MAIISSTRSATPAAPPVRPRSRSFPQAVQPVAPASRPTYVHDGEAWQQNDAADLLTPLLQSYATHNAEKNTASTAETKAKKALNEAMLKGNTDSHTATVVLPNGNTQVMTASIEASEEEYIDPAKVFAFVGKDLKTFLGLVSISKQAIVDALGANAATACTAKRTKPAALRITKD